MSHLTLDRLSKNYGCLAAVDDVSLDVNSGECIALLGPSGCGKTTMLRLVAGFITPDAGGISLEGRRIEREPPYRRQIGMVFQNYALFPHMSVAGNIVFGLEMRGVAAAERRTRVAEALDMVGLADYAARYPAQLSGGQQQRVALARALVTRPSLLLLDEPLSNLDAWLRVEMRQEIGRLRKSLGITTLFVTHDQEEALALADRIAVMQAGRIVECAAPQALSEHPGHVFTAGFLGARTVLPGRVENGVFSAGDIRVALTPGAPARPSHAVLRAARLTLNSAAEGAPLSTNGIVAEAAWLGDAVHYEIAVGAQRLRVLRPTTEPALPPGTPVLLQGGPDAITWIGET